MLISYPFRDEEIDVGATYQREPYERVFFGMAADEYNASGISADQEKAIAIHTRNVLHGSAIPDYADNY